MSVREQEQHLLALNKVSQRFKLGKGRDLQVLDDLNVTIDRGEIVAFLGPSGCGKTTMLKIMAGLLKPSEGGVLVQGDVLKGINKSIAMVFQSSALFPWFTVEQNVGIGMDALRLTPKKINQRIDESIEMVGLGGFEEAYPKELSPGLRQRVSLARALAVRPAILALDEPFSALDALSAEELRAEVVDLWEDKENGVDTVVMVTHNIEEAVYMAQKVFVFGANPGHIRTVIKNPLPYPRDTKNSKFQELVDVVHGVITEALIPEEAKSALETSWYQGFENIPPVGPSEVTGLLEVLANAGGSMDIFDMATETGSEFGHCLAVVKTAELLGLIDTPRQKVVFTDVGRRFVDADVADSKEIFSQQVESLKIFQLLTDWLEESPENEIPREEVIARLHTYFPNEKLDRLFDTLVSFGRFAEILSYNAKFAVLTLADEEPEEEEEDLEDEDLELADGAENTEDSTEPPSEDKIKPGSDNDS